MNSEPNTTRADLASLEAALEESLRTGPPRDLTDRIMRRLSAEGRRPQPRNRTRAWLSAAIVLFAVGALLTARVLTEAGTAPPGVTPQGQEKPQPLPIAHPANHKEIRGWVETARSIRVRTLCIKDAAVTVPLDPVASPIASVSLEITTAKRHLLRCMQRMGRVRVRRQPVWPLEVDFVLPDGKRRMVLPLDGFRMTGALRPQLGVVGMRTIRFRLDADATAWLEPLLVPHLRKVADKFGVAVGRGGTTGQAGLDRFDPNLEQVTLAVPGTGDYAMLERFVRLRSLTIYGVGRGGVTDKVVEDIISKLQALRELRIVSSKVTDAGLEHLARLPLLTSLSLTGNLSLTGTGFAAFADHGSLTSLDLAMAANLTDEGIGQVRRIPGLTALSLRGIRQRIRKASVPPLLTPRALDQELIRAAHLRVLELDDWLALSEPRETQEAWLTAVAKVVTSNPSIEILRLGRANLQPGDLAPFHQASRLREIEFTKLHSVPSAELNSLRKALSKCKVTVMDTPPVGVGMPRLLMPKRWMRRGPQIRR